MFNFRVHASTNIDTNEAVKYDAFDKNLPPRPLLETRKPQILIVDDDIETVAPLNIIFHELGCNTNLAFDGVEAAIQASRCLYDLIVLDWRMPGFSGGESIQRAQQRILENMKMDHRFDRKKIPVITYTAQYLDDIKIPQCSSFYFIDHWKKPIRFGDLSLKAAQVVTNIKNKKY